MDSTEDYKKTRESFGVFSWATKAVAVGRPSAAVLGAVLLVCCRKVFVRKRRRRAIVSWVSNHPKVLVPSTDGPSLAIDVIGKGTLLGVVRETGKGGENSPQPWIMAQRFVERFAAFAKMRNVQIRFRCAHVPSGNGIIERSHRTIKRIATRTRCSVLEALYWHNVTPKDNKTDPTAPANATYTYRVCIKGIDAALVRDDTVANPYTVRTVWVKNPHGRCTKQFNKDTVTQINSPHSVSVDGIPHHIKDVRPACGKDYSVSNHVSSSSSSGYDDDDDDDGDDAALMVYIKSQEEHTSESSAPDEPMLDELSETFEESTTEEALETIPLTRSTRQKLPAPHCHLCDLAIREECNEHARKRP
ncbi:unnamed protein product [Acanthosepion pharaonis]|uniref:Integrase catalytic domain-containing protein n=1 Tax=Acanthosepion pharaonis TaxID=158019 RepID=A0A812DZK0_ACAPH|nr:unnamed protein product [Sepia pharaonis]